MANGIIAVVIPQLESVHVRTDLRASTVLRHVLETPTARTAPSTAAVVVESARTSMVNAHVRRVTWALPVTDSAIKVFMESTANTDVIVSIIVIKLVLMMPMPCLVMHFDKTNE